MEFDNLPILLNKKRVAEILGCTTRTVDRLIAARGIPFIRLPTGTKGGHKIKFDPHDIQAWLKEHRHSAENEPARDEHVEAPEGLLMLRKGEKKDDVHRTIVDFLRNE